MGTCKIFGVGGFLAGVPKKNVVLRLWCVQSFHRKERKEREEKQCARDNFLVGTAYVVRRLANRRTRMPTTMRYAANGAKPRLRTQAMNQATDP